jgi:hypothetical protein
MGALSILSAGAKQAPKAVKAKPLVSKFDEALESLSRPKGTGNEFLAEVMKKPGVKKSEVEDRKLKQAFEKAGKITKAEAQEIARKNAPAKLEEKVFREPSLKEIEARANEMAFDDAVSEARDAGYRGGDLDEVVEEIHDDIMSDPDRIGEYMDRAAEDLFDSGVSPQHADWTLPGGDNYREILLKMPAFAGDRKIMELEAMRRRVDPEFHSNRYQELTQQIDALKAEKAQHPEQFQGVSAHFAGEPGIIASLRVKDRVGPKGEKILHVEEVQSDWHQKGRSARNEEVKRLMKEQGITKKEANALVSEDFGYRTAEIEARRKELSEMAAPYIDRNEPIPKEIYNELSSLPPITAVPDAPFKKNWQELALKKALNYAVENGYDKIAITPGAEQASRYKLSNHINQVEVYKLPDGMYNLEVIDKNGKSVTIPDSRAVDAARISEIVGKDVAQKAISQADESGQSILGGLDLEVGGKGMKGFYDDILPGYLNEFGKKYGTKVGELDIETVPAKRIPVIGEHEIDYVGRETEPAQFSKVHGFDITPEMREEISTKGLPLYQQIGMPLGAGAAASELEIPEPEYAAGGSVNYNTQPDMNDGGAIIQGAPYKRGGKVKITDNLDEMFMEVNDKKFQRK